MKNPASSLTSHYCRAAVITCIDFRLRMFINQWTFRNIKGGFDQISIAGGVKNLPFILDQIDISYRLHLICDIYLVNHEDCGAYGAAGTFNQHTKDLKVSKKQISHKYPKLKITLLYLKLNGEFVKI